MCWQTVEQQFIPALAIASAVGGNLNIMTGNYIESRLKRSSIIWFLWMLFAGWALVYMMIQLYDKYDPINKTRTIGFAIFFGILFLLVLKFFNEFKFIRIDRKSKILRWYSPIVPWGRKVDLTKYSYKLKISSSQSESLYLIDNSMISRVRIGGIFLKNFEEISSAIGLKEIKNYEFNMWKYLKLIYTGRIKI